jgi:chromosome segregation ATPase
MPFAARSLLRSTLLVAGLMLPLSASPGFAAAEPREQVGDFKSALDDFIAYLKSESNDAGRMAARIARENKDSIDAAKSRIDAHISDLRSALSGQKDRLKTLHKDASTAWKELSETAVASWVSVERQAHEALDWIGRWMRNQSRPEQRPEIPV